jgi:anti-anti-sigma factor
MPSARSKGLTSSEPKVKKPRAVRSKRARTPERVTVDVERLGEWMPVDDIRELALKVVEQGNDLTFNLQNVDYLDASALQILLVLETEQKNRGRHLDLVNASPNLRQWFEYSGTAGHFFQNGAGSNE